MPLPRRWSGVLFITFMVLAMCFVMSLAMTVVNHGLRAGFLDRWGRSFAIGVLVAWPTAYVVVPRVRQLVDWLTG
jgi:hypothetical protein